MKVMQYRRWGPILLAIALLLLAVPVRAAITPESDVLLPWFEVDLAHGNDGLATRFSVVNASPAKVDASITVYTNWGIPVLDALVSFGPAEAKTLILQDWIQHGRLPDRTLTAAELANLQAMLTGLPSPVDGLYYASPFAENLAVGYVIIRSLGDRPDALWGDTHSIDLVAGYLEAESLTALDHALKADCDHHGIRFDNDGLLFEGDELIVWSGRRFAPSPVPDPIGELMKMTVRVYDQAGNHVHDCFKQLQAVQPVMLCHDVDIPIGWLEIITADPTVVLAHLHSTIKASAELHSYCLRQDLRLDGPGITIDKKVDGVDAGHPPGPKYERGSQIGFEYHVTNSGSVPLTGVEVVDDTGIEVTCPKASLDPGETMICTARSMTEGCTHANTGTASGAGPDGRRVTASDVAYYHSDYAPAMTLELLVNGDPADEAPGPLVEADSTLAWTFVVTNTGDATLSKIVVELKHGDLATCPQSELAPGESMTCTAQSLAQPGQRHEIGTVTAADPCDFALAVTDPAYYRGRTHEPGIELKKYVNDADADMAPGPTIPAGTTLVWKFVVTNTGNETLTGIVVTDDGITPECPKTALEAGESMICTATSIALTCQHTNVAHARGTAGEHTVNAQDAANYFGEGHPQLTLEVAVNGDPADTPPGPWFDAGTVIALTYAVTNSGNMEMNGLSVTDDGGRNPSCPKTTLLPGESMTCTASTLATPGTHDIAAKVTGQPLCHELTQAEDPAFYRVRDIQLPGIDILKMTNGQHPEQPPGPQLPVGSTVTWSYLVTNTGALPLIDVAVTDDGGVTVSCPKTALEPGESMTCTASGIVQPCQYHNTATVTAHPVEGEPVVSMDDSFYFGQHAAAIAVVKRTNGQDMSTPPGLLITTGAPIEWTYTVTNTGDVALTGVNVMDDRVGAAVCPATTLAPGASMVCTASGLALAGQQGNIATATGTPPCGNDVIGRHGNYYYGLTPRISLEKLINGEDADDSAHAVVVPAGAPVLWSFVVTNTGDVALLNVAVSDPTVSPIVCPADTLAPGESMTCTAAAVAGRTLACNTGRAVAVSPQGTAVEDSDTACYSGTPGSIAIEKKTNGHDADTAPGPEIHVGDPVTWTYVVTNNGDFPLSNVTVTDDKGVTVTCPKTTLAPAESMTCTGSGVATLGQYSNIGTATGRPGAGTPVTASDPSHYIGVVPCNQGCTPGYWKNHTDSWPAAGYSPWQKINTVFGEANRYGLGNFNLLSGLGFGGGSGNSGAAEILLRAAIAALLNAAHPEVSYPRTPADVIADTNSALATESRDTMLALAASLDADNNLGCPLH